MKTSKSYNKFDNYYSLHKDNNDDKTCCLKFSQCDDNNHQLWNLNKEELKSFVSYVKKIEKMPWQQIYHYNGLNFEKLNNISVPNNIDDSIPIYSMRVDRKFRVIGYRSDHYFYIIWFDNNHETC